MRLLYVFVFLLFFSPVFSYAGGAYKETNIKAVYIYNFIKFIEWPGDTKRKTLCIMGDRLLFSSLRIILNKNTGNHIHLANIFRDSPLKGCKILFIGRAVTAYEKDVLRAARKSPILTIGDDRDFLENGGIIAFTNDDNKIRFLINTSAARTAGIRIRSQLLQVAKEVR